MAKVQNEICSLCGHSTDRNHSQMHVLPGLTEKIRVCTSCFIVSLGVLNFPSWYLKELYQWKWVAEHEDKSVTDFFREVKGETEKKSA